MDKESLLQREKDIYIQYETIIAYFIAELEVRDTEYPIEVFNEIRATFTHLSRYKFENAYNKYHMLSDFLVDSNEAILFASSHSKKTNIINIVSIIVTVVSIIFGIIGWIM